MKISKTVYSLIYPESRQVLSDLWQQQPLYLYEKAYLKHQDKYHEDFLKTWQTWSSSIVQADYADFTHSYPANGSSEVLREVLAHYASEARQSGITPTLHVFQGEYEGYEAYARSYGVEIIKHDRNNWTQQLNLIQSGHYFFLSQPSSIDGNIWLDYDNFMTALSNRPGVRALVDLCYVGCVPKEFTVNVNYPVIHQFCFSLSKVFGVYYHRIGGLFSRTHFPGLQGNVWFKNLFSLLLGTTLMKKFGVYQLPRKYQPYQQAALQQLPTWTGSDVVVLIHSLTNDPEFSEYNRGPNYRACLTPLMDQLMQGKS
jgi:hypothetical protein